MRIATWNVNSLRVRLSHVVDWLIAHPVDVLCLQETKLEDVQFPHESFTDIGYHAVFSGQKTYNGVAILSKAAMSDVLADPAGLDAAQKRFIAATYQDIRVVNVYVPNGAEVGSDKFRYKLEWLGSLRTWVRDELKQYPRLAIVGDFNIAPEDRDVYDPEGWAGSVLVSDQEREQFKALLELGMKDAFRLFDQEDKNYSWWDYRAAAFRRNMGLRIDHILLSEELAASCHRCVIDREPRRLERPSDHAPVWVELK